jgi:hypothetical protein
VTVDPGEGETSPVTTSYQRAPDVLWRRTADRVLLAPPGEGEMVSLSGTGVALWELLAEPSDLDRLATRLAVAYRADEHVVAMDVLPVLRDLARRGFVHEVPPPDPGDLCATPDN